MHVFGGCLWLFSSRTSKRLVWGYLIKPKLVWFWPSFPILLAWFLGISPCLMLLNWVFQVLSGFRSNWDEVEDLWENVSQMGRNMAFSPLGHERSPLTVWITINCGKFWKRWQYQITWRASWETYMQVRKQQLELDMEQQTGSKQERSTSRLYIVTLLI